MASSEVTNCSRGTRAKWSKNLFSCVSKLSQKWTKLDCLQSRDNTHDIWVVRKVPLSLLMCKHPSYQFFCTSSDFAQWFFIFLSQKAKKGQFWPLPPRLLAKFKFWIVQKMRHETFVKTHPFGARRSRCKNSKTPFASALPAKNGRKSGFSQVPPRPLAKFKFWIVQKMRHKTFVKTHPFGARRSRCKNSKPHFAKFFTTITSCFLPTLTTRSPLPSYRFSYLFNQSSISMSSPTIFISYKVCCFLTFCWQFFCSDFGDFGGCQFSLHDVFSHENDPFLGA